MTEQMPGGWCGIGILRDFPSPVGSSDVVSCPDTSQCDVVKDNECLWDVGRILIPDEVAQPRITETARVPHSGRVLTSDIEVESFLEVEIVRKAVA